jgi:hypothetical protein
VRIVADTRGAMRPVVVLDADVGGAAVRAEGAVISKGSTERRRAVGPVD